MKNDCELHSSGNFSRGATLVEIAVILPIFLSVIFFVITVSLALNARTSVRAAVANGSRQALTRGNPTLVGGDLNIANLVSAWLATQAPAQPTGSLASLRPLLASPGYESKAFGTAGWYVESWKDIVGMMNDPTVIPPEYVLALVYAHAEILQSVGGVRFPCDPLGNPADGDGPGCMRCLNLNASSKDRCPSGQFWTGDQCVTTLGGRTGYGTAGVNILHPSYPRNFVGLYCEYAPDDVFITSIYRLLDLVTGQNTIAPSFLVTGQSYFEAANIEKIRF